MMKIAMMVRGYIPVPRPDDLVYVIIDLAQRIAKELVKRGHSVDFFAPDGSRMILPAKLETLGLRPLAPSRAKLNRLLKSTDLLTTYMPALWDHHLASEMFRRAAAGKYDVLHFHHPESALSLAPLFPQVPVVYSVHDELYDWHPEIFPMFSSANQRYISISDRQRHAAPRLPYLATVYNGVDTNVFKYSPAHEDYLLFVGRIVAKKGPREAVRIAKRTGRRLVIIGPVLPEDAKYFNTFIKPYLDDKITYLGHMKHEDILPYFQKATCLLAPVRWEEPFGMTLIEAMACGTPVVALRRGSVPELIVDGQTGFICRTVDEMVAAVGRIGQIDRAVCRRHVEQHFAIKHMIDGYERAFRSLIEPDVGVPLHYLGLSTRRTKPS